MDVRTITWCFKQLDITVECGEGPKHTPPSVVKYTYYMLYVECFLR